MLMLKLQSLQNQLTHPSYSTYPKSKTTVKLDKTILDTQVFSKFKKKCNNKLQSPFITTTPPNKTDILTNLIYKPNYESSWFQTENLLSIDSYIKILYNITKLYLDTNINTNINTNTNININKSTSENTHTRANRDDSNTVKAIVVPHSGLRSSGLCAASAYYQLTRRLTPIKRIILFCTDHGKADSSNENSFISTSYTDIASYTGIGNTIQIDTKSIEQLKTYILIDNPRFQNEYSFNTQIPFIESINHTSNTSHTSSSKTKNVLLLPFMISNKLNLNNKKNSNNIRAIMAFLKELLLNEDTVLICTSDFSHINGEYETKVKTFIYQNIRKYDNSILQFIYNELNGVRTYTSNIDDILFINNAPSCGTMSMYLFAKLLNSYTGFQYYNALSSTDSSSSSNSSKNSSSSRNTRALYPRISCYYTSLIRNKINILNRIR